jgi:hypothetical protein
MARLVLYTRLGLGYPERTAVFLQAAVLLNADGTLQRKYGMAGLVW